MEPRPARLAALQFVDGALDVERGRLTEGLHNMLRSFPDLDQDSRQRNKPTLNEALLWSGGVTYGELLQSEQVRVTPLPETARADAARQLLRLAIWHESPDDVRRFGETFLDPLVAHPLFCRSLGVRHVRALLSALAGEDPWREYRQDGMIRLLTTSDRAMDRFRGHIGTGQVARLLGRRTDARKELEAACEALGALPEEVAPPLVQRMLHHRNALEGGEGEVFEEAQRFFAFYRERGYRTLP